MIRVGLCPVCLKLTKVVLKGTRDTCERCDAGVPHVREQESCEMCADAATGISDLTLDEYRTVKGVQTRTHKGIRIATCDRHAEKILADRGWQDEEAKRLRKLGQDNRERAREAQLFDPGRNYGAAS